MMDGPPLKKPRSCSPTMNSTDDIPWRVLNDFNSELPDELNLPSTMATPTTTAQTPSLSRKAEETIQKNRNLSQLLSSNEQPRSLNNLQQLPSQPMRSISQPTMLRHSSGPVLMVTQRRPMPMGGNMVQPQYINNQAMYQSAGQMPSGYPMRHADFQRHRSIHNIPMGQNIPMGHSYSAAGMLNTDGRTIMVNGGSTMFQRQNSEMGYSNFGPVMGMPPDMGMHNQGMHNFHHGHPNNLILNSQIASNSACNSVNMLSPPNANYPSVFPMSGINGTVSIPCPLISAGQKHVPQSVISGTTNSQFNNAVQSIGGVMVSESLTNNRLLSVGKASSVLSPESNMFPISPSLPQNDGPDGAPSSTEGPMSNEDKLKEVQTELRLVLHAHKCQQKEQTNGIHPQIQTSTAASTGCPMPAKCSTMKMMLKHMTECQEGKACKIHRCTVLRQIIIHWKTCKKIECPVCSPLKNRQEISLTPNLNSSHITNNSNSQPPNSTANDFYNSGSSSDLKSPAYGLGPASVPPMPSPDPNSTFFPTSTVPSTTTPVSAGTITAVTSTRPTKQWQNNVAPDLRNHLVQKLVNAIFPTPDPKVFQHDRMNHLVQYAKKVEGDMYDSANSKEEYYQFLAEKIYKIKKELEEKRMRRMIEGGNANTPNMHHLPNQQLDSQLPDGSNFSNYQVNSMYSPMSNSMAGQRLQQPTNQGQAQQPFVDLFMDPHYNNIQRLRGPNTPVGFVGPRFPVDGPVRGVIPGTFFKYQDPIMGHTGQMMYRQGGMMEQSYANNHRGIPPQHFRQSFNDPFIKRELDLPSNDICNVLPPVGMPPLNNPNNPTASCHPSQINTQMHHQASFTPSPPTVSSLPSEKSMSSSAVPSPFPRTISTTTMSAQPSPMPLVGLVNSPLISSPQINGLSLAASLECRTPSDPSSRPPSVAPMRTPRPDVTDNRTDIIDDTSQQAFMKMEPMSLEDFKYESRVDHEDISEDEGGVGNGNMLPSLSGMQKTELIKMEIKEESSVELNVKLKQETPEADDASAFYTDTKLKSSEPNDLFKKEESGDSGVDVMITPTIIAPIGDDSELSNGVIKNEVGLEDSEATPETTLPPMVEEGKGKRIFTPEELRIALFPVLRKLYEQIPESEPFQYPVDPIALGIPDYAEIIKFPMDMSTIASKLDSGSYEEPWGFVDDIGLMFDNAWLYNRMSSKVYKYCSKLSEVFDGEIDAAMQSLGICCGRRHVFSPQVLCCFGKQLCAIPRDTIYYNYKDRYIYCEKCFNELQGEEIEMVDDPTLPGQKIMKEEFVREKNDKLDQELFVHCKTCERKMHKICVLHMEFIWTDGFICDICLRATMSKRKENKYTAKRLPTTKLGTYLETRVNSLLKRKNAGAGDVTIRVLSSYDKLVDVKPGMRSRFVQKGEMPDGYPYRVKAMFAFEEIDGVDVCFFGMHVQEYGSDCPQPNCRRVYIAYLDSVHFFQPRQLRTTVYHEILIGYLEYAKQLGYEMAHIWACPPSEGDDYIFHCHPPDQKIPKPKRLQDWYKKMLDKAMADRVIVDFKDIYKDAVDNKMDTVTKMPYFEGDFWPNILEECIKELERDEVEKRRRAEEVACLDTDDFEIESGGGTELETLDGKKKGQKSGSTKKKNSKSKKPVNRKNKSGLLHGGNDLSQKLLSTMEKHKEGFFVIRLQTLSKDGYTSNGGVLATDIKDPDPLMGCDLMDGRDAFLTLARDKHYEFSSLRRAKYSSLGLLYELHNQARDGFIYNCNDCKANVETRYHCAICDDFDLCTTCYKKSDHIHKAQMARLGLDLDDGTNNASQITDGSSNGVSNGPDGRPGAPGTQGQNGSSTEARANPINSYISSLVHACHCRDANCRLTICHKMKRFLQHMSSCKRRQSNSCKICKQMLMLCLTHAKQCKESRCQVPHCATMKQKLEQQRQDALFKNNQLMRRRMQVMRQPTIDRPERSSPFNNSETPSPISHHPPMGQGYPQHGGKYLQHHSMGGKQVQTGPHHAAMLAAQQAEHMASQRHPNSMMHQRMMQGHHGMVAHPNMPERGKPMNYEEMMYRQQQMMQMQQSSGQMDPMYQNQSGQPGSQNTMAMILAKFKSPSTQQQKEAAGMMKSNPQMMSAIIKQNRQQRQMMPGGGEMIMEGAGLMMDESSSMMGHNSGPPMMQMDQQQMLNSQHPRLMSSQWLHQQRQPYPPHASMYTPQQRMRMSFSGGGTNQMMHDEMMTYSPHMQQQQLLMMQKRIQMKQQAVISPHMAASQPRMSPLVDPMSQQCRTAGPGGKRDPSPRRLPNYADSMMGQNATGGITMIRGKQPEMGMGFVDGTMIARNRFSVTPTPDFMGPVAVGGTQGPPMENNMYSGPAGNAPNPHDQLSRFVNNLQ